MHTSKRPDRTIPEIIDELILFVVWKITVLIPFYVARCMTTASLSIPTLLIKFTIVSLKAPTNTVKPGVTIWLPLTSVAVENTAFPATMLSGIIAL